MALLAVGNVSPLRAPMPASRSISWHRSCLRAD